MTVGASLETSEVGIDWLQLTVPEVVTQRVFDAVMAAVGGEAPKVGKGRRTPGKEPFEKGTYWPCGIELHSGGRERAWLIVQGSACTQLGFPAVLELGRSSMAGASVTRLDIRRDVKGEAVHLVRDIERSCEALELRRVRQFTPYPIKSADGEILGRGVLLGSYSSPKFVRCYDKGLETGTAPECRWVRYEAQLREEIAHKAACEIFRAETVEAAGAVCLDVLHGVADFRVGPRGDGVHVGDLPRPAWWESFLGSCKGVRVAESQVDGDVERWRHAVQVQYGGVLVEAAKRAGVSLATALRWAFDGASPTAGTRDNPMVDKLVVALTQAVGYDS